MNLSGHALSLSHSRKEKDPAYKWDTSFKNSFSASLSHGALILVERDELTDEIRHPWYSYFVIVIAVCCGGMIPSLSQLMSTPYAWCRQSWRLQIMGIILMLMKCGIFACTKKSALDNYHQQMLQQDAREDPWFDILMIIVAGVSMFLNGFFLVWAAEYTIMTHVMIIGGLGAVLMILLRIVTCKKVKRLELIGTAMALIGCIIQVNDHSAAKVDGEQNILLGDFIAFFTSISTVFNILCKFHLTLIAMNYLIEKHYNPIDLTLYMAIAGSVFSILGTAIIPEYTFDINPITGIFGWVFKEELVFNVALIGGISGVGTFLFYPLCLVYFSPIVLGNVLLLEPIVAQLYGVLLGLDKPPGLLTYIGATITLLGVYQLVYAENQAEQVIKSTNDSVDNFQWKEEEDEQEPGENYQHA